MRRNFPKPVQKLASRRAEGKCEGCHLRLKRGEGHFDHIIPDALGGEPTIENCQLLCAPCHKIKTATQDIPIIAKTKRIQDRDNGIRKPSQIRNAGFRKASPQRSASRPLERRT